jgi:hypothetical protein
VSELVLVQQQWELLQEQKSPNFVLELRYLVVRQLEQLA